MPITRSAKKALRQSARRRDYNLLRKEAYKELVKKIKKTLRDNKPKDARDALPGLYAALDKAAKTNAIKKNKASRLKSRITQAITSATKTP